MLFSIKDILIKLSFLSFLFIFFFQETTYAKEYSVNDCVATFSDDWIKKELNNNQSAQDKQYDQLFLINEERHEMIHIFAVPQSNEPTDISEIEKTESGRNAIVQVITKYIKEENAEEILFSEYRYTNSFGTVYTEYLSKEKNFGKPLYVREYNIIKNSTLYTFSFIYALENDFTRGAEYDQQIVNNLNFSKNLSTSQKKLQEVNTRLDALLNEASKASTKNSSTSQQKSQEDNAKLDAVLHGGSKAFIYTAVFIGIGFLCKKLYK